MRDKSAQKIQEKTNIKINILQLLTLIDDYFYRLANKEHDEKIAADAEISRKKRKQEEEALMAMYEANARNLRDAQVAQLAQKAVEPIWILKLEQLAQEVNKTIETFIKEVVTTAKKHVATALAAGKITPKAAAATTHFIDTHIAKVTPATVLHKMRHFSSADGLSDDFASVHENMRPHLKATHHKLKSLMSKPTDRHEELLTHLTKFSMLHIFGEEMNHAPTPKLIHVDTLTDAVDDHVKSFVDKMLVSIGRLSFTPAAAPHEAGYTPALTPKLAASLGHFVQATHGGETIDPTYKHGPSRHGR